MRLPHLEFLQPGVRLPLAEGLCKRLLVLVSSFGLRLPLGKEAVINSFVLAWCAVASLQGSLSAIACNYLFSFGGAVAPRGKAVWFDNSGLRAVASWPEPFPLLFAGGPRAVALALVLAG